MSDLSKKQAAASWQSHKFDTLRWYECWYVVECQTSCYFNTKSLKTGIIARDFIWLENNMKIDIFSFFYVWRFERKKTSRKKLLPFVVRLLDLLNHMKIIDGGRKLSLLTPHTSNICAKLSRLLWHQCDDFAKVVCANKGNTKPKIIYIYGFEKWRQREFHTARKKNEI